jgi:predicted permease
MSRLGNATYRLLVFLAFPARMRSAYGDDMTRQFHQERARLRGRPIAIVLLWCRAIADALVHGLLARFGGRAPIGVPPVVSSARRLFRRDRLSTLAVIGSLAIGIGTATTAHAIFNFAIFRPVPGIANPDSVVSFFIQERHDYPSRTATDMAHLRALREHVLALDGVATSGRTELPFAATPDAPPRIATITWTTRDYFQVLGVRARTGRLFLSDEYESPDAPVAVISERLWHREFDDAPDIVGRRIRVNGELFTIVGVTADFRGAERLGKEDLWLPSGAYLAFSENSPDWAPLQEGFARLRPGATLDDAQAQSTRAFLAVGAVRRGQKEFTPQLFAGVTDGIGFTNSRLMAIYRIVMIGAVLLLVLACANAANLMLARYTRRAKELSLRAAIGASRRRIVGELMTEAALIAGAAGTAGLMVAAAGVQLFTSARLLSYLPTLDGLSIDGRVAAFALAAAAITTMVFGVVPAITASGADAQNALHGATSRATPRGGVRSAFVAVQLALSLVLLVGAVTLTQTVRNLRAINLGMNIDDVFAFSLEPQGAGYTDVEAGRIVEETVARLRSSPGVSGAIATWGTPLEQIQASELQATDSPRAVKARMLLVSDDFFRVLGIQVLAGREFTEAEARVAFSSKTLAPSLINESAARALFGERSPLGATLTAGLGMGTAPARIIGVVSDTRSKNVRDDPPPAFYVPIGTNVRNTTISMRTSLTSAQSTALVRSVLQSIAPRVPAGSPRMLASDLDEAMAEERLLARVGIVVASAAALLALAGLCAVVMCFVSERTREFGIRLALGAPRVAVTRFVLARVLWLCGGGFALGIVAIVWAGRLLTSRLYGVSATDPLLVGGALGALLVTGLAAAWLPARRAGAVDPAITLRAE